MDWRPNATQLSSLSPGKCRKLLGQTGKPATGLLPFLPGLAEAQAPKRLRLHIGSLLGYRNHGNESRM